MKGRPLLKRGLFYVSLESATMMTPLVQAMLIKPLLPLPRLIVAARLGRQDHSQDLGS